MLKEHLVPVAALALSLPSLTSLTGLTGLTSLTSLTSPRQAPSPLELVDTFFERLNALDGSEASVEAFASLYQEDGQHITGPESHQLGTVTYDGRRNVSLMARELGSHYADIGFEIEAVTAREQTARLFHLTEGPWGGSAVAVEYRASLTRRSDGRRFYHPGAAFFQIRDGKLRRVRFYRSEGERAEVEPMD